MAEDREGRSGKPMQQKSSLTWVQIGFALVVFLFISMWNPLGVKQNSESATQDFFETVFAALLPPEALTTPEEVYDHIRTSGPLSHRDRFEASARTFLERMRLRHEKSREGEDFGADDPPADPIALDPDLTAEEEFLLDQRELRRTQPLRAQPWSPIHVLRFDDVVMAKIHGDDPRNPKPFARHHLPLDRMKGLFYLLGRLKVSVIFLDIRLLTDTSGSGGFCDAEGNATAEWKRSVRRPLRRGEADAPTDRVGNLERQLRNRVEEKPFLFIAGLPTNHVLRSKKARIAETEDALRDEAWTYLTANDPTVRRATRARMEKLIETQALMEEEPVWLPQRLRCLRDVARVVPARWSWDDYPLAVSFGDSNHQNRTIRLLGGDAAGSPDLMPTATPILEMFAAWCAHPNSAIREFPECNPNWNPRCPDVEFDTLVGGTAAVERLRRKCAGPDREAYLGVETAAENWAKLRLVRATEHAAQVARRVAVLTAGVRDAEAAIDLAQRNHVVAQETLQIAENRLRSAPDAVSAWQVEDARTTVRRSRATVQIAEETLEQRLEKLEPELAAQFIAAVRLSVEQGNALRTLASDDPASVSADLPVAWLNVMTGLGLQLDRRLDPGRPIGLVDDLVVRIAERWRQTANLIDGTSELEQRRLAPRPYARAPEFYQWLDSDVPRRTDDDGVLIPDMSDIHGCRPERTFLDSNRPDRVSEVLDHAGYMLGRLNNEVFGDIAGTENAYARGCSNIPMHEAFFTSRDWPLSVRRKAGTGGESETDGGGLSATERRQWRDYLSSAFEGSAVIVAGNFDNARDVVPSTVFGSKVGALLHAEALQCLLWYGSECPRRPDRLLFEFDLMDLLEMFTLLLVMLASKPFVGHFGHPLGRRPEADENSYCVDADDTRKLFGMKVRRYLGLGYRRYLYLCIPLVFGFTVLGMMSLPFPSADLLALILVLGVVFREGVLGWVHMLLWHIARKNSGAEAETGAE